MGVLAIALHQLESKRCRQQNKLGYILQPEMQAILRALPSQSALTFPFTNLTLPMIIHPPNSGRGLSPSRMNLTNFALLFA